MKDKFACWYVSFSCHDTFRKDYVTRSEESFEDFVYLCTVYEKISFIYDLALPATGGGCAESRHQRAVYGRPYGTCF